MPIVNDVSEISANHPMRNIFESLGIRNDSPDLFMASLPFTATDVTAGSESELQAVVVGDKDSVDLPLTIERSNYYANIARRVAAGDTSRRAIIELERYLSGNDDQVWENSWVRFQMSSLCRFAQQIFHADLHADKRNHQRGLRSDLDRFVYCENDENNIRIPISYLLKLSLAEAIGSQPKLPTSVISIGIRVMSHFLNDNTSPETFSFFVLVPDPNGSIGKPVSREKSKRFLLSQLLTAFANRRFGLQASGQRAMVYFAPHPPVRQKQLNSAISDAYYRELFMSPCLSGWNDGESKHAYMSLCHEVLSRSRLNAVSKLREAGIIANNLVVLPDLSNTSLANNGTHVSLGSRMLTAAMKNGNSGFGAAEEKLIGDLTIKIVEHFLPLFVGTYSAAPYRFDFADLHPERVLGFLPHELDYTHLRMIWRRWRKKADLNVFGYRLTPFGPQWVDHALSLIFRLKGDWVIDSRLIDYPVVLMSTERSPALNGTLGNVERLKSDLAALGVFDTKMSLYLLYRMREFAVMGFTGFEGRHYSLFESLTADLSQAVNMQVLITALAIKYQAQGKLTHAHIPDIPFVESERRQIFFAAAIGVPTFFVHGETQNHFLREILRRTTKSRPSRRYPKFLRVFINDFRQALLQTLIEDGADLIEMFRLQETIKDLKARLDDPSDNSAIGKLISGMLSGVNRRSPMQLHAEEFNRLAENYYRNKLRRHHLVEAFKILIEDLRSLELIEANFDDETKQALHQCLGGRSAVEFAEGIQDEVIDERTSEAEILMLINLMLLSIRHDMQVAEKTLNESTDANSTRAFSSSIR